MSHPTTPPSSWSQVRARLAHRAGDHSGCRPSWCLAARYEQEKRRLRGEAADR